MAGNDVFLISDDYLNQKHVQKFINDVESYVDMSNITSYRDLEYRLKRFFRKKGSKEPYKHQTDIFAKQYGINPKTKAKKLERQQYGFTEIPKVEGGHHKRAKIKDHSENRTYLEPIFYKDVKMKEKGKMVFHKKREVVRERHIPDRMVKAGYRYRIRDRKTGRIIAWEK